MWSIVEVWSTLKIKLSYRDELNRVRSVTKATQHNDVTNRIGAVYTKNDIELSWLIGPRQSMKKTRQDNGVIDRIGAVYAKKWNWVILTN